MFALPATEIETCELKKSLAELKEGLVSLAAMLNKNGYAKLWFGVAPNGLAVGLDITEKPDALLKRTGRFRRHGPTQGGYWEVIN